MVEMEKLKEPLLLSGGANGADLQWGMNAGKNGHSVIHWSFTEHNTEAPDNEVYRLTDQQLKETEEYLKKANETLKRKIPYSKPYMYKLLCRNYFQVFSSNYLYAVTSFDKNNMVQGGTAWAVQMFIDNNKPNDNLFIFDQENNTWNKWVGFKINKPVFLNIDENEVLKPSKIWTGIGSRNLMDTGKNAIRNLLNE